MKTKNKLFISYFIILLISLLLLGTYSLAASPTITSEASILVEASTGKIIYEKNSTQKMYPASTTKILTSIIVLEKCNLTDVVTVSESALSSVPEGYVTCDLVAGEQLSVEDLLYALMLPSANDAAYALAEHVGHSVDEFSDLMNAKAREIGCLSSHFVNPNGVHENNHYSTAYDLYLIAKYAMKNDTFRKIVATKEYILPATELHPYEDRILKTTNSMLDENSKTYYKYLIGIKTGHTTKAGNCLVAEASRDGLDFISVTLNGDRFTDTRKLFDYAYDNYTLTKIIDSNSIVDTIEIKKATKETKDLDVIIDKSITVISEKTLDINSVIPEISYKEDLVAPIPANTIIGSIKYKVDDIEYSANLLAKNDVEKQSYVIYFVGLGVALLCAMYITKKPRKRKKRV